LNLHNFRDTFAVNHLLEGVLLAVVSRLLRHRDISTTMRNYAAFSTEDIGAILRRRKPIQKPGCLQQACFEELTRDCDCSEFGKNMVIDCQGKQLRVSAGITRLQRPHNFRTTFITSTLNVCVPIPVVSQIVRYRDIRITIRSYGRPETTNFRNRKSHFGNVVRNDSAKEVNVRRTAMIQ
jgi:site-specific recombinase XerD